MRKIHAGLAFALLMSASLDAKGGPATGLTMGPEPLFRGLRGGVTLHGGGVGQPNGDFDAVCGGGFGVLLLDRDGDAPTISRPRIAFGVEGGYRFRERAEIRSYVTGFGVGRFTFGGGLSTLIARPGPTTLIGVALGPEIDAHFPVGGDGPVLTLFLRGEVTLVNRSDFADAATLGARFLINLL